MATSGKRLILAPHDIVLTCLLQDITGEQVRNTDINVYVCAKTALLPAWSFFDENIPIGTCVTLLLTIYKLANSSQEYISELPKLRFPYTKDTFMNPQNLWVFS